MTAIDTYRTCQISTEVAKHSETLQVLILQSMLTVRNSCYMCRTVVAGFCQAAV